LLARHQLRLLVLGLLSPLYGLRTSRYRRGYAFTRTLSGEGLVFQNTHLHQHQVVIVPGRNYASYPSNSYSELISAKRLALAKSTQRAKNVYLRFKPLLVILFTTGRGTGNSPHIGLKALNEKIDDPLKPYLEVDLKAV
jgi:hypothetical protein